MPNYVLNRNYNLLSVNGCVSFIKGEPTWVVPALEKEVIAIGAERVDGETPDFLDPEKVPAAPLGPVERRDEILTAFQIIAERNDSKDFTGAGTPTVKAVEKITDFDVDRTEITELWAEFKAKKADLDN